MWIGKFIPALDFQPGLIPILGSAGMIFVAGLIGLLTMRMIGGADCTARHRK